mgnify:FL=1
MCKIYVKVKKIKKVIYIVLKKDFKTKKHKKNLLKPLFGAIKNFNKGFFNTQKDFFVNCL